MKQIKLIENKPKKCCSCNNPLSNYLGASSYSLVCGACGAICDNYQKEGIIDKIKTSNEPLLIPIGTEGTLADIKYIVIAHTRKKENGTNYQWSEFTLYNPIKGNAFLTVYEGHWTYLTICNKAPKIAGRIAEWNGQQYQLYSKYKSKVVYASGEFTSKFVHNSPQSVEEYILPPYLITKEYDESNITWFKGIYYKPNEIKSAFNLNNLPTRKGIGQIQPFVSKFSPDFFRNVLYVIALIWGLLQFYYAHQAKEELIYSNSYVINDSLNKKDIYTPTFELKNGTKNMEIKISTNVDNNWMYNAVTLVNEKTGDVYDFELETEYYHGYEGGENWSEGSNWNSKIASSVPEGTYYMIIQPQKPENLFSVYIDVTLKRDIYIMSNGIIILLILAAFPIYYFYNKQNFEQRRWYNSNYYPFNE